MNNTYRVDPDIAIASTPVEQVKAGDSACGNMLFSKRQDCAPPRALHDASGKKPSRHLCSLHSGNKKGMMP